jgi:hypothetical protein
MTRTYEDGMTEVGSAKGFTVLLGLLLAACGTKVEPGTTESRNPEPKPKPNTKPKTPSTKRATVAVDFGEAWIYRSRCGMRFEDLTRDKLEMKQSVAAFRIDTDAVSCDEWQACVEAGVCEPLPAGQLTTAEKCLLNRALVSWSAAKRFCEWHGARLPTAAEWTRGAHGAEKFPNAWTKGRCEEKRLFEDSHPTYSCKSSTGMLFELATLGNEWTNDENCDLDGVKKRATISLREVITENRALEDYAWFRCAL